MNFQRWAVMSAAVAAAALLRWTVPAIAHHSAAPFYDSTRRAEAQGTVTRLLLKNPHSYLYFESQEGGKKIEWQIELGSAASLARTGWTQETLKPGTTVKVSGQPSRAEGSHGMCCAKITRPDGNPITPGGRVTEEQHPPQ